MEMYDKYPAQIQCDSTTVGMAVKENLPLISFRLIRGNIPYSKLATPREVYELPNCLAPSFADDFYVGCPRRNPGPSAGVVSLKDSTETFTMASSRFFCNQTSLSADIRAVIQGLQLCHRQGYFISEIHQQCTFLLPSRRMTFWSRLEASLNYSNQHPMAIRILCQTPMITIFYFCILMATKISFRLIRGSSPYSKLATPREVYELPNCSAPAKAIDVSLWTIPKMHFSAKHGFSNEGLSKGDCVLPDFPTPDLEKSFHDYSSEAFRLLNPTVFNFQS